MYIVECYYCREANQLHENRKGTTVRCHICECVIQVGDIPKEVVRNINIFDNHEDRIRDLEAKQYQEYQQPVILQQPDYHHHHHHYGCYCSNCCAEMSAGIGVIIWMIIIGSIIYMCCS